MFLYVIYYMRVGPSFMRVGSGPKISTRPLYEGRTFQPDPDPLARPNPTLRVSTLTRGNTTKDINPISNTKEDEEDLRQSVRAGKR